MTTNNQLKPDEELLADLYYVGAYAQQLKDNTRNGKLTKADAALATRMLELAGKCLSQVNLRTGPW